MVNIGLWYLLVHLSSYHGDDFFHVIIVYSRASICNHKSFSISLNEGDLDVILRRSS